MTNPVARLTPREKDVLWWSARLPAGRGYVQDIADRLGLTRKTVATHLSNLRLKIGTHSRGDDLQYFSRHPAEFADTHKKFMPATNEAAGPD